MRTGGMIAWAGGRAILLAVAGVYGISLDTLLFGGKAKPLARARMLAMYYLRRLHYMSYPEIGRVFGGMDHTTAMNAVERIEAVRASGHPVKGKIDALERQIMESVIGR